MTVRDLVRTMFATAALVVVATNAFAQAVDRRGFLVGISLPLGGKLVRENNVSGDQALMILADGGRDLVTIGAELQLGGALTRRLAALATFSLDVGFEDPAAEPRAVGAALSIDGRTVDLVADEHSTDSTMLAGNIQYWLTDALWIRGGFGAATLNRALTDTRTGVNLSVDKGFSPAIVAGVGVALGRMMPLPVEVQFRYSSYSVGGMRTQVAAVFLGSVLR